jgi:putative ABC transport system substrate-binding protein
MTHDGKPVKESIPLLLISTFLLFFVNLAEGQATKTLPRIGFISSTGSTETPSPLFEALRQRLRDLGYIEDKNILIVQRYADGKLDRMPSFVQEFVQQKVDIIVAPNNVAIAAVQKATKTIPVVMITTVDPVEAGYVKSFAQPGGNITGVASLSRDISAKRVELLKELLPRLSRAGILWDSAGPGPAIAFREYEEAAQGFKFDLRSLEVRGPTPDLSGAFRIAKAARLDALIVVANPLMNQYAKQVFELATKNRLPSITEERRFVNAGGLVSYGPNRADLYRRAAEYVVEILKGAKPGDLPVKLPSKFEIFINLKTAQQIGVTIPQHFLVQADKVIQ